MLGVARRLTALAVTATVATGGGLLAAPSVAQAATVTGTVQVAGTLKVRAAASTSAPIVGTLPNRARVTIACYVSGTPVRGSVRSTSAWDRLTNGRYISHAYVRSGALTRCAPPRTVAGPVAGTVRSTDGAVNLRSGPSRGARVTGKVASGQALRISCAAAGDTVSGTVSTTNQWDRLTDGRYVSHAYVVSGAVPVCAGSAAPTTRQNQTAAQYIAAAVPGAQAGWRQYGVPPSVTIAQSILESGWGRSGLAANDRNFFGIKCFSGRRGSIATGCHSYRTSECTSAGHCYGTTATFRTYATVADSFRDHGSFLRVNSRYAGAFGYSRDADAFLWKIWKAGYATDPQYYVKTRALMRTYNLYRYDTWR